MEDLPERIQVLCSCPVLSAFCLKFPLLKHHMLPITVSLGDKKRPQQPFPHPLPFVRGV